MSDDYDTFMTSDEMAEAKHKADMDDKMKTMIREILFYVLLLFLLLVVINGQHDVNSYRQNANIIATFTAKLNNDVSRFAVIIIIITIIIIICSFLSRRRVVTSEAAAASVTV